MTNAGAQIFDRLERFYDAVPRDAAVAEEIGGLVLFVRNGPGWPYYARPRLDARRPPTADDLAAVRARQAELGVPQAFEWVHETTPDLLATARAAGLSVLLAPLLVLDPAALPSPGSLTDVPVRLADPDSPSFGTDVALQRAVAQVGFADADTRLGPAGPADRDATLVDLTPDQVARERHRVVTGRAAFALAEAPPDGVLASGVLQRVDDVGEIAGVATLPSARRRGLGAAVTAALARHAVDTGVRVVFLSAGSEDVARIYARVGFSRIGTACIAEPASPEPASPEPGSAEPALPQPAFPGPTLPGPVLPGPGSTGPDAVDAGRVHGSSR